MTQEAAPGGYGPGHDNLEAEILAALWEEVPFPRLPFDAPTELKDMIVEIENPRRVYTIHHATRRHNLQLLVEKFIVQLRYGCGHDDCPTPSCFTCRTRLAGKSPIRRYSPASARTLAIYLASQDGPERHLCPHLRTPRGPSDAIKPLIFGPQPHSAKKDFDESRNPKRLNGRPIPPKEKETKRQLSPPVSGRVVSYTGVRITNPDHDKRHAELSRGSGTGTTPAKVSISERSTRQDYRSFAANVIGTAAFKMLEWLTPNNLDEISKRATSTINPSTDSKAKEMHGANGTEYPFVPPATSHVGPIDQVDGSVLHDHRAPETVVPSAESTGGNSHIPTLSCGPERRSSLNASSNSHIRPVHSRRSSSTRVRATSLPKPVTADHLPDTYRKDMVTSPLSPLTPTSHPEHTARGLTRSASTASTHSSNDQSCGVTESAALVHAKHNSAHGGSLLDGDTGVDDSSSDDRDLAADPDGNLSDRPLEIPRSDSITSLDTLLPQSMASLSIRAVEFFCDVLQEDRTSESHLLEPQSVQGQVRRSRSNKRLKRKKSHHPYPQNLKLEWKMFIEQSIFNVLSDPHAILKSFANQDGLIDSHTLWHSMLRMTRVAPSLVFDSLWNASASLFAPPKSLRLTRSPAARCFPKDAKSLSNEEAGQLLSVCFHALVAAAPLVTDVTQLFDLSRIRSRGLTLSESGAVARQPSTLCLHYEDVFTDDMALRLARRLLAAIPTRSYFDELTECDVDSRDGVTEPTTLEALLSHLDRDRDVQASSDLSPAERDMHEKRVPILLLDWARTVMLAEWPGTPEVSGEGPFGGALSLIYAMFQKRKSLHLADVAFRTEYFGDRLDSIEMPVSWLSFSTTRQKTHLLEYPYMFHPTSLVTYFRAVNFSRMSRAYEVSSSLQERIKAIITRGSLVTDGHQQSVLQDLLKTASGKYLILDVRRTSVLGDSFDQLWRREERELVRPLKVHLGEDSGEEGFDSGGVQQEFFRLAISEALDPDYGAFTVDDRTRMTWFHPGSLQPLWKYELTGLLMSLAVFNGLTLPITFPKALYMKLLGEPVTDLHHIADGWPDLANGLTTMLDWDEKDGAVEDIFTRTYEFSVDMFGQPISRQMTSSSQPKSAWPQYPHGPDAESLGLANPEEAPLVTGENREAYVSDYIRYLTDISIAPQYEAFARGFYTCLNHKSLTLLTPNLLQSLVEGVQEIDISDLRRAARYVGWDASHRTIRDFWSVVKRYDDRMKRKLLEFVTASDRVPVGGMRNVQFVVQRNGEEDEGGHLPTAYTCYGTLLLPEYKDKDVLRERLGMALENAQGFGFA